MSYGEKTKTRYASLFGPDAFVPGYCGKCPSATVIGADAACGLYSEPDAPRYLPDEYGNNAPPDWCPIRHLSTREQSNERE